MNLVIPRKAIVIGTQPDRKEQLDNLLRSIIHTEYVVFIVDCDGYEIGKMKEILSETSISEFVFLQDSVEIKDISVFNKCFENTNSVSLCNAPQEFGCYLGKYKRSVLEKMVLPDVKTKLDSVNYEEKIYFDYKKHDQVDHLGGSLHNVDNFVDKWGHKVMVLENEYLIKYKSIWNRSML